MASLASNNKVIFTSGGSSLVEKLTSIEADNIITDDLTVTGTVSLTSLAMDTISSKTGVGVTVDHILIETSGANSIISTTGPSTRSICIVPSGGAFILNVPDNTNLGGNDRGQYAVDLQMVRDIASRVASGPFSSIIGGYGNTVAGTYSTNLGGYQSASNGIGSLSGGLSNISTGDRSITLGGSANTASNDDSSIIGSNVSTASADSAIILGGSNNTASGVRSVILQGLFASATASDTIIIGGGPYASASAIYATVIGGNNNISSGSYATIINGTNNTASGRNASLVGCSTCTVSGSDSFVSGSHVSVTHNANIVFTDAQISTFSSSADSQFSCRFANGYRLIGGPLHLNTTHSIYSNNTAQTTDGTTPVTLFSFPVVGSTTYMLDYNICGRNAANDSGAWKGSYHFGMNSGATISISSAFATGSHVDAGINTATISASISGSNMLVRVTGVAVTTINWVGVFKITELA